MKTVGRAGLQRADFLVKTDSPALPEIRLTLSANLVQEREVLEEAGNDRVVTGRAASLRYKLVTRRKLDEAALGPTISATPWNVFCTGDVQEQESPPGIIETIRGLILKIPPIAQAGPHGGKIRLRWPDGSEEELSVALVVAPSLVAKPAAIILDASNTPVTKAVILRSDVAPFRVKGVAGATVRDFRVLKGETALEQVVELKLDTSRAQHSAASVRVLTDHPHHPIIVLSLIIPHSGGGR
jgi:hypothetical protein